jgi:hypothetical protein
MAGRTYLDAPVAIDGEPEPADVDQGTRGERRPPGQRLALGREHGRGGAAATEGGGGATGGPPCAPRHHDGGRAAGSAQAQRLEGVGRAGAVVDHGDRRGAVTVHDDAGGDVGTALADAGRADGGVQQYRSDHDAGRCSDGAGHTRPVPHDDERGHGGGDDEHRPPAEVTERQPGGPVGDGGEPPGQQARRDVQHRGRTPAEHAGGDAGREAPGHERPGGRDGEQVGRHAGDGDVAEGGQQHRQRARLRRQRDGEGVGEGTGTGDGGGQPRCEADDAERRADREAEADGADEQRVDEQQGGDGQGQHPDALDRPPERGGEAGDGGHRAGPQDRGFEPHEHGEATEHRKRAEQPRPAREPGERRAGERQDEGDVGAGHGQQVGEPGGAEVVGELRWLVAVVAEHDAGEQRPLACGEPGGAAADRAPESVGRLGDGRAAPHVEHLGDVEATDDPALHPPGRQRQRWRSEFARQQDLLPRQAVLEVPGGRPVSDGLDPPSVGADEDGHAGAVERFGVADEGDPAVERAGGHGVEAGPGVVGEPGRRERGGEAQQPRPAGSDRHRRQDGADERGRSPADMGTDGGDGGEQDGGAIAHGDRRRGWRLRCTGPPGSSNGSRAGRSPPSTSASGVCRNRTRGV